MLVLYNKYSSYLERDLGSEITRRKDAQYQYSMALAKQCLNGLAYGTCACMHAHKQVLVELEPDMVTQSPHQG